MSKCHEHTPGKTTLWIPKEKNSIGEMFGGGSDKAAVKVCTDCGALFVEKPKPKAEPVNGL